MKFEGDDREWYFVLVWEWLAPTESGREVLDLTYDTLDEALEAAREHLERERPNFISATGLNASEPARYGDLMCLVNAGDGPDPEWYDCVKIVPMAYGVRPIIGYWPENPIGKGVCNGDN